MSGRRRQPLRGRPSKRRRLGLDPLRVLLVSNGDYWQARWYDDRGYRMVRSLGPKLQVPRALAVRLCNEIRGQNVAAAARKAVRDGVPDGPRDAGILRWKGEDHRLPQQAWRIVSSVWGRETIPLWSLVSSVWGEESQPKSGAVRKALTMAGKALNEIGVRWRFRIAAGAVAVDRSGEVVEKDMLPSVR